MEERGEEVENPVPKESVDGEAMTENVLLEDRAPINMDSQTAQTHTLSVHNDDRCESDKPQHKCDTDDEEKDMKGDLQEVVQGHGGQSEVEVRKEVWERGGIIFDGMDVDSQVGEQSPGNSASPTAGSGGENQPKARKETVSQDKKKYAIKQKLKRKKQYYMGRSGKSKKSKGGVRTEQTSRTGVDNDLQLRRCLAPKSSSRVTKEARVCLMQGIDDDLHLGGTLALKSSRHATDEARDRLMQGIVSMEMEKEAKTRDRQNSKGEPAIPTDGPEHKAVMASPLIGHGLGFGTVGIPLRFLPYWKLKQTRSETFQHVKSAVRDAVQALKWKGDLETYRDQPIHLSKVYYSISMAEEKILDWKETERIFKIGDMWQENIDRMGKRLIEKMSIRVTNLTVDGYLDITRNGVERFEGYGATIIDSECIDLMTQYLLKRRFLQSKNSSYVLPTISINGFFTDIERYMEQLTFQPYVKNRASRSQTLYVPVNEENH